VSDFDIPGRVDFSISEAQWLADLHGIENDLRDTDKLCTKSLALMRPMPTQDEGAADWLNDSWLAWELSFAAVIKYGRTFGSGVRSGIPVSWINQLPDTYKASHKYFKDIRDKFVAHSVNAFEDNQVFAYLSPQFAPVEVSSITVDTGRFVSLSSEDLLNLKSLAGALKQLVQQEIAVEKSRVLGIARSLPLADLLARETDNRPLPSAEDVGKRRPRA
jgi:hypothetical protein